ncbi:MAG: thioredoxin family protein [Flavipsychrobacter sp.]|nr:thioredoxin family protein [Flavipsychrobacter sp.]
MKKFANVFLALLVAFLVNVNKAGAQEVKNGLTWYNDVEKVYELSKKTQKPVFAFFTGSDWCGWCHRLEANVFHKPGFKEWAKSNVILLELDFPRNKKLPEKITQQNAGLQQFFQVQGYPTIWIFDLEKDKSTQKFSINARGQLGYPNAPRGQEEAVFLQNANSVLKNQAKN